jgi:hypothetical protein
MQKGSHAEKSVRIKHSPRPDALTSSGRNTLKLSKSAFEAFVQACKQPPQKNEALQTLMARIHKADQSE